MGVINPGHPILLRPSLFRRVPFTRLPHLRGKPGAVRRVIGREEGRVLLECEIEGRCFVCWDFEVRGVSDGRQRK